jgi:predicted Zn-dependent protease
MSRREKLEAMLAEAPDDVFLQYALAMEFASANEPAQAAARLEALLRGDPHYVPAWFQLGRMLQLAGRLEQARQVLTRGMEYARQAGDAHAEAEMGALVEQLRG